jgi:multiple sugar transport system ATP-binding protein
MDAPRQLLMNLENLSDGAVLPVGGNRSSVLEDQAVLVDPIVGGPQGNEPLSNLDAKLRVQTRTQIASLQRRLGVTTVYVTHDQIEALTMGDRIAVLKDGIEDVVVSVTETQGLATKVDLVEELGADGYLYGHSEIHGRTTNIVARVDGMHHAIAGDTVYIASKSGHVHVFDPDSGLRISRAVVE